MDYMKDLETLCEIIAEKIAEKTRKIKTGRMDDGDLETIDKLTHTMASIKKIMAFDEDGGESYRASYRGPYSRNMGNYARKRDSMGRYSGERGYSRTDLVEKLRDLMMDAPDDRTRQEIQRMVDKMEV